MGDVQRVQPPPGGRFDVDKTRYPFALEQPFCICAAERPDHESSIECLTESVKLILLQVFDIGRICPLQVYLLIV